MSESEWMKISKLILGIFAKLMIQWCHLQIFRVDNTTVTFTCKQIMNLWRFLNEYGSLVHLFLGTNGICQIYSEWCCCVTSSEKGNDRKHKSSGCSG